MINLEIVDQAITHLDHRLTEFRKMKGRSRHCRNEDIFYIQELINYAQECKAREPLYQGYDVGTSPLEADHKFVVRYGRSPAEIIIKGGAVLAGPITKEERDKP